MSCDALHISGDDDDSPELVRGADVPDIWVPICIAVVSNCHVNARLTRGLRAYGWHNFEGFNLSDNLSNPTASVEYSKCQTARCILLNAHADRPHARDALNRGDREEVVVIVIDLEEARLVRSANQSNL